MKIKKVITAILTVIFAVTFCFSAFMVVRGLVGYKKADEFYDDLQNRFVSVSTDDRLDASNDANEPSDSSDNKLTTDAEDEKEPSGDKRKPTKPKNPEKAPVSVNFDALLDYNSDIVGWLYCEDTPLNYPVAKAHDNDYYLRRDLQGNYLVTGTIFADFRCDTPAVDENYMIFGHNMDNGTIFGMLKNYAGEEYLKDHPVIYYLTPDGDYMIEVYTGATVTNTDRIYRVKDTEGLTDYVRSLAEASGVEPLFELDEDDKLVTLSTCSYAFENARYILIGRVTKLEKAGE